MKSFYQMTALLCAVVIGAGFSACSDDEWDWSKAGSQIEMSSTRAFVLNEGSMGKNNSGLTYFDWTTDATYDADLFMAQNGVGMGDVGQDIIVGNDGNLYVIVANSQLIYKLSSVGVRLATLQMPTELGNPRYAVEEGGYLYITCYGGLVAKVDKKTMEVVAHVAVGANPEYIIKKDNVVYCTCSGWGKDKRVAAIDTKTFEEAEYFDVMDNPDRIIEVDGHIFVQGYGAYYDYPWGELNVEDGTYTELGNASAWAAYGNTLYTAFSSTNWTTYATTTTFQAYNVKTGELSEGSFLKNAPEELATKSVYGMSVNQRNGDIYVMTTDFTTNGMVYHFKKDGAFVAKFATSGINPRKIVFLN